MKIQEFRLVLPFTCTEYKVAQRYMVVKFSSSESTGEGDGVEVLKNEPFENEEMGKGQYTYKRYHLEQKLPTWLRHLLPKAALTLEEEAWNAFPRTKHIMRSPYFTKVYIAMESLHYDNDKGTMENAHKLGAGELKKRTIEYLDIAKDTPGPATPEEDPSLFKSLKSGRGPLKDNWQAGANPVMCAYKLVHVDFPYYGMGAVERFVAHTAYRKLLLDGHRKMFCWLDEWTGKTMDDVLAMEAKVFAEMSNRVSAHKDASAKIAADTASSTTRTVARSAGSKSKALPSASDRDALLSISEGRVTINTTAATDGASENGLALAEDVRNMSTKSAPGEMMASGSPPVTSSNGMLKTMQQRSMSESLAVRVVPDTDAVDARPNSGLGASDVIPPMGAPGIIRVTARRTTNELTSPLYSPPPGSSPNRPPVHKGRPAAAQASGDGQQTPTLWAKGGTTMANGKPTDADFTAPSKAATEPASADAGTASTGGGAFSALSGFVTRMMSSSDVSGSQQATSGQPMVGATRGAGSSRGSSFSSRTPAVPVRSSLANGPAVGMSEAVVRAVESLDVMIQAMHAMQQQQQQQVSPG